MIAASNTNPLILLDKANHLWVLGKLFKKVVIPEAVNREWLRPGGYTVPAWLQVIPVPKETSALAKQLYQKVDAGEAEAIALSSALKTDLLILDDLNGRRQAKDLGLPVVGTIGILTKAKQRGIIQKLAPVLDLLREHRFYIDDELRKSALALVHEA